MKTHEFLRLIQEIGQVLGLSAPTISLVITIYKRFCSDNTRDYRQEVIITACFYLVGKIVEDQRRIREILAVLSVVTKLYQKANLDRRLQLQQEGKEDTDEDPIKYLPLTDFESKDFEYFVQFVTPMNNEQYIDWKMKILDAEQHLLRIINYDLKNEPLENYQILLNYLQIFNFEQPLRQLIFDLFQDSYFVTFQEYEFNQLECVKGAIFLGIRLHRMHCLAAQRLPRIKEEFLHNEWWEEHMQVSVKVLQTFESEMLDYYSTA